MLIKADHKYQEEILNYCAAEPVMNLFIIGDIELYGFETEFQDVWIQKNDSKITGILLRYHDNLIVYSKTNDMTMTIIMTIVEVYNIKIVSGKKTVVEALINTEESIFTQKEMFFSKLINAEKLINSTNTISIATISDARDIAEAFGNIKEFKGIYSDDVEDRFKQISSRINHKEGEHLFLKKAGKIISHGNTAAETSSAAMIGGLMTIEGYRHQGYASQIISMLSNRLIGEYKEVCLLGSKPIENTFAGKLGFKTVGQWWVLSKI